MVRKTKLTFVLIFIMNIAILLSCYENPVRDNPNDQYNWEIIYPDTGIYGENLISNKSIATELGTSYSVRLKIVGNYSTLVTIPNFIILNNYHRVGWMPIIQSDRLVLIAEGPGTYDCEIIFNDNQIYDEEINIYENDSDTPTRIKVITQEKSSLRKGGEYEK